MQRYPRLIPITALALAVAGLAFHALQYRFVSDDAYITFRYSWNFAFHNEIVFNLGERVEGYTNFLWMLLLGLLLKAGLRPDVICHLLGILFGGAVVALLYALSRLCHARRPATPWELLGAALLPTIGGFAVWCSGGLETQLFTALGFSGVVIYVAEEAGRVRRRLSGLLFALAAMTRPEGVLLFGLTGLHRLGANLIGERRIVPRLAEILWVLGFIVPYGAFFAWRYSYYGYPFPNTYYVKAGGDGLLMLKKWGLPYLWDFIHLNRLYVAAPFIALLPAALIWRRRRAASAAEGAASAEAAEEGGKRAPGRAFLWSYLLLLALPYAAYVCWVGGDFMAMGRFLVPILPLLVFAAQEAMRATVELPPLSEPGRAWRATRFAPLALLLLGLGVFNATRLYALNQKLVYSRWGLDTIAYLKKFAHDRILIGRWLRRYLPKDTYLAVGGAGAIVYSSRFRSLDTYGLNDRWIAHEGPRSGDRPGHGKFAPQSYVLRNKPDLMCHRAKHQDWPYKPPPHEERYWRSLGYRWVCVDPDGLRPRFYCCLKRLERDLGPFPAEAGS